MVQGVVLGAVLYITIQISSFKYRCTKTKLIYSLLYMMDHSCMDRLWMRQFYERSPHIITNNLFIRHSQLSPTIFNVPLSPYIIQFQGQQMFGIVSTSSSLLGPPLTAEYLPQPCYWRGLKERRKKGTTPCPWIPTKTHKQNANAIIRSQNCNQVWSGLVDQHNVSDWYIRYPWTPCLKTMHCMHCMHCNVTY